MIHGDDDELTRYAFHMDPQYEECDGMWTARYPEADWSVCAPSKQEAHQRLGEEFIARQNAGTDPLAYADDIYRRHLGEPIPGVYAMDNELYRELLLGRSGEERKRAFAEAELRRALGQTYTKDDYLGERNDPT